MFCGEWALVKHSFPAIKVIPLRCRCWSCDECRPGRVLRLIHEAKAGLPTIFITLTSKRIEGGDPALAARELVAAWRTVRKEYMDRYGPHSIPFLAVFEETKKGWPHLHIVARCKWLSQRELSKRMDELIGSPVCWVESLKTLCKIANYVTKYIGKNPYRFGGTKRYWRSLDYLTPEDDPESLASDAPPVWEVVMQSVARVVMGYEDLGFHVEYTHNEALLTCGKPP